MEFTLEEIAKNGEDGGAGGGPGEQAHSKRALSSGSRHPTLS